jgi:hypothetical protein
MVGIFTLALLAERVLGSLFAPLANGEVLPALSSGSLGSGLLSIAFRLDLDCEVSLEFEALDEERLAIYGHSRVSKQYLLAGGSHGTMK